MTSAEKQIKFFRPKKTQFSGALTLKFTLEKVELLARILEYKGCIFDDIENYRDALYMLDQGYI